MDAPSPLGFTGRELAARFGERVTTLRTDAGVLRRMGLPAARLNVAQMRVRFEHRANEPAMFETCAGLGQSAWRLTVFGDAVIHLPSGATRRAAAELSAADAQTMVLVTESARPALGLTVAGDAVAANYSWDGELISEWSR